MNTNRTIVVLSLLLTVAFGLRAEDCPMHAEHSKGAPSPADGVHARGDEGMGFDGAKTTHHFRLRSDGGSIEAETKDANDLESRAAIRRHFADIAVRFSDGDFALPKFIHGEMPPGVPVLKELRSDIAYAFEPTERGGRVRIRTSNAKALAAVHEFLKYQIREHHTGDRETIDVR